MDTQLIEAVATDYGTAWNDHDLDRIMQMHTETSAYHLNTGQPETVGATDVRAAFQVLFETWPDIHFATRRLYYGSDHFVHEWTVTATPAAALQSHGASAEPSGQAITFDGVDVIAVDRGLVARKDTYLDIGAIQTQLGLVPSASAETADRLPA